MNIEFDGSEELIEARWSTDDKVIKLTFVERPMRVLFEDNKITSEIVFTKEQWESIKEEINDE